MFSPTQSPCLRLAIAPLDGSDNLDLQRRLQALLAEENGKRAAVDAETRREIVQSVALRMARMGYVRRIGL